MFSPPSITLSIRETRAEKEKKKNFRINLSLYKRNRSRAGPWTHYPGEDEKHLELERAAVAAALLLKFLGLPLWINNRFSVLVAVPTVAAIYPWSISSVCSHQVATIALDSQVPAGSDV